MYNFDRYSISHSALQRLSIAVKFSNVRTNRCKHKRKKEKTCKAYVKRYFEKTNFWPSSSQHAFFQGVVDERSIYLYIKYINQKWYFTCQSPKNV